MFGPGGRRTVIAMGLVITSAAGCGKSLNSRFYMLAPLPVDAAQRAPDGSLSLAVGPVTLPEYLKRPQIVTHVGDNELVLGEYDRWAEPLAHNVTRVLVENLSTLLNTPHVAAVSQRPPGSAAYQVTADLVRFDRTRGGPVTLTAHWTIRKNTDIPVVVRKSNFTESVNGAGYAGQVGAMNRALNKLSEEMAAAIKKLQR